MVLAWSRSGNNRGMRSSSSLCKTYGGTARGGGGCRHSGGGGNNGRGNGSECRIRAGVGLASRGKRRVVNLGPEVVPSACLGHSRAREGKEMKNRRRRVSEVKEKKWDGFEMK